MHTHTRASIKRIHMPIHMETTYVDMFVDNEDDDDDDATRHLKTTTNRQVASFECLTVSLVFVSSRLQ